MSNQEQGTHQFKTSRPGGGGKSSSDKSSSSGSDSGKQHKSDKQDRPAPAPWRFIHPSNENATCTVEGREYKFCAKCVYHQTGQKGFFTTGKSMHSTSKHRSTPPTSDSSSSSEGNLGAVQSSAKVDDSEVLPATPAILDPSEPGGMYAGAFTAEALGFHSEVLPSASSDDIFYDAVGDDANVETVVDELAGWDFSGSAFLAARSNDRPCKHPAIVGAYVHILNSVNLSMGKRHNVYGMITSTPKPGGLYYKVSVFDRGLQCFKDMHRCRDNFVVVGASAELPPLLTAWKPDDTTGPLLAVGLGSDSKMVHLEYLFCSRECPIGTESQYSLLAQVRQHLVTYPLVIQRDQVPDGYLDDETAVNGSGSIVIPSPKKFPFNFTNDFSNPFVASI